MVVDVREDLRRGRQPLRRILQALQAVARGQDLLLLATFEPVPLYRLAALRGFAHEARPLGGGDWEVRFRRRGRGDRTPAERGRPSGEGQPALGNGVAPPEGEARWTRLDNRGLEPPEPMVRTFGALGGLPAGEVLELHNDRRPLFLYAHLEERGYRYQTVDGPDGSALVRVWRGEGGVDAPLPAPHPRPDDPKDAR